MMEKRGVLSAAIVGAWLITAVLHTFASLADWSRVGCTSPRGRRTLSERVKSLTTFCLYFSAPFCEDSYQQLGLADSKFEIVVYPTVLRLVSRRERSRRRSCGCEGISKDNSSSAPPNEEREGKADTLVFGSSPTTRGRKQHAFPAPAEVPCMCSSDILVSCPRPHACNPTIQPNALDTAGKAPPLSLWSSHLLGFWKVPAVRTRKSLP